MEIKDAVNFIFELGHLKRQQRSGWCLAGIKNTESDADHMLRTAQIGYILAVMEGDVNPEEVASLLIMHDIPEIRVGDQHKVAARYYNRDEAEENALEDQLALLGSPIKDKWKKYFHDIEHRENRVGIIAKDADWLEVAFQAKEYIDLGYEACVDWINNVEKALETDSAKKILKEMKETKFTDWWQGLKKMTYKKLDKDK